MTSNKTLHLLHQAAHRDEYSLFLESEGDGWKIALMKLSQDPRYDMSSSYFACDFLGNERRRKILDIQNLQWLGQLLDAQLEGFPIHPEDIIHGYSLVHGHILPERVHWHSFFQRPGIQGMRESFPAPIPSSEETRPRKIDPPFWAGRKKSLPPPLPVSAGNGKRSPEPPPVPPHLRKII